MSSSTQRDQSHTQPAHPTRPIPKARRLALIPTNVLTVDKPDPNFGRRHQPTTDFNQFFSEWIPFATTCAFDQGVAPSDVDEIVQHTFVSLWQGNVILKYDQRQGTPWEAYIRGHIRIRVFKYRNALWTRAKREIHTDFYDELSPDPLLAKADHDRNQDHHFSNIEVDEALYKVLDRLTLLPATRTKDLARLFWDMIMQVVETGTVNYSAIAKKYGYSRQAIQQQAADLMLTDAMQELRAILRGQ